MNDNYKKAITKLNEAIDLLGQVDKRSPRDKAVEAYENMHKIQSAWFYKLHNRNICLFSCRINCHVSGTGLYLQVYRAGKDRLGNYTRYYNKYYKLISIKTLLKLTF